MNSIALNAKRPLKHALALVALMLLPLQTLSAAPGPYADREDVRQFARDISARNGLDLQRVEASLAAVTPIPKVIEYIRPPSTPGVRSWERYRTRFIDNTRTRAGQEFWHEHRATLVRAEAEFGVPQEIIVSIIGIETIYGRNTGSFNTLAALATLGFDYPPRAPLFLKELEALFVLAQEQNVEPESYKGSYAGALGLPQFLPSSIRNFALDYDADGHVDLLNSPKDAIGGVANFLARHGWVSGTPIAQRARTTPDQDISVLIAGDILPQFNLVALKTAGISAAVEYELPAALIELVTPNQAPEYWLGYQNFYVITRYNRSSFYAMSVYQFAQILREAGPAAQQSKNSPASSKTKTASNAPKK